MKSFKREKNIFLVTAVLGVLALVFFYDDLFFNIEFDKRRWNEVSPENEANCVRGKMVQDLFKHHLKLGDNRNKIEALLGPSESKREPAYVLGLCSAVDYSMLHLEYDKQDALLKYEVKEH